MSRDEKGDKEIKTAHNLCYFFPIPQYCHIYVSI